MVPNVKDEVLLSGALDASRIEAPAKVDFKPVWKKRVTAYFLVVHLCGLYGLYLILTGQPRWKTIVFTIIVNYTAIVGVTAGAHRLWSHRAYKAKLPLQILLIIMQSIAFQFSAITWVRDHRIHHKYSDTDADPHNSNRGLFFSHIGWLMMKKHPDVKSRGARIDLSDAYSNPVLRLQHEYYVVTAGLSCFILPTLIPLLWGETLAVAWNMNCLRYLTSLHAIFLINSAAHKWGNKPYDKTISPTQNLAVSLANLGEGFHNYHHSFPFDYRAAELGNNILNPTTKFIDFFAWVGWAYDLKTTKDDIVRGRSKRTGDGGDLWS